jgi:sugar-specific transcriptional regulator TrmB
MKSKQPAPPPYRPASPRELREQRRNDFDKRVEAEKRSRKR